MLKFYFNIFLTKRIERNPKEHCRTKRDSRSRAQKKKVLQKIK
ncbi:hypothetical protein HMPREF6123_0343 [Oribacterium sinus F0268]|uniref:Uncharacterized protein n=1 Tax=Oribacterium sinus F0268 TaxID=585501 RepID=C2KV24_9FIRM|nr:hypothetical protein HMPREF6123_0343 [Oribacterium sinus F0268]